MKSDLKQIRQDLDTMRDAVGMGDPPLGSLDVWGLTFLGMAGVAFAIASWLAGGFAWAQMALPSVILFLVVIVGNHWLYTRRAVRNPARDRSYNFSWVIALAMGIIMGGFYIWARFFAELSGPTLLGLSFYIFGTIFVFLAISNRWSRFFLGLAVPFFVFGFSATMLPAQWIQPAMGITLGLGGFISAGILYLHLRSASGALQ